MKPENLPEDPEPISFSSADKQTGWFDFDSLELSTTTIVLVITIGIVGAIACFSFLPQIESDPETMALALSGIMLIMSVILFFLNLADGAYRE